MFGTLIDQAREEAEKDPKLKRKVFEYQRNLDAIGLTNQVLNIMCLNVEGVELIYTDLLQSLNMLLMGGNESIQNKVYIHFLLE